MAGSIGYDVAAHFCLKITIGHINGNPLFSFAHKSIQQQRVVNLSAGASHSAVQFQSLTLVCIELFGII